MEAAPGKDSTLNFHPASSRGVGGKGTRDPRGCADRTEEKKPEGSGGKPPRRARFVGLREAKNARNLFVRGGRSWSGAKRRGAISTASQVEGRGRKPQQSGKTYCAADASRAPAAATLPESPGGCAARLELTEESPELEEEPDSEDEPEPELLATTCGCSLLAASAIAASFDF